MLTKDTPKRSGIIWPVLRGLLLRRRYRATMVDGADWVSLDVPRLRRLLAVRRHYLGMGFR